jgi:AcrR family transcriptional regulator
MTDQAAASPAAPAPVPAPAGRRARSRKGEGRRLREEILDAAEALLLQTGAAEQVSIRAVADAVGVTPPSIYRHFPDKDTLIYEVWDRRCGTLDDAFEEALAGIDDPIAALMEIGRAYVRFGLENPEPYRLVFMTRADPHSPEEDAERLGQIRAFMRAVDLVQQAIDAGRLKPEFTDAMRVATIIWAHVHGLVSLMITKTDFPWPRDPEWLDLAVMSCPVSFLADPA